jgi:murein DD-endopeptidase MepM/ murein hydrolase activator NlpD
MNMEDIRRRHARFIEWQTGAQRSAEVIRGLHGRVGLLRLDADGKAEEGWDNVPPGALRAGGYDEDRAIYGGEAFTSGDEPRTLHLGLDIAAPAGTDVFAPLAGMVHSFQDNAAPFDYGPTIILEHTVAKDVTFHTLYGHLSRESLEGLHVGRIFSAGQRLATLGTPQVNGNWPPHLHFQLILDIGECLGDFPGVFRKSQRDTWTLVCPDPRPLLGIFPS